MPTIALLMATVCVRITLGLDLLAGRCLVDSGCEITQYCDRDFPNPVGKCIDGLPAGKSCLRDRHCASKDCSFFTCKERMRVRDGPCKSSIDCPLNQYCDDIPNRDEFRMCYDRKCIGSCRKDSQVSENNVKLKILII